MNKLQLKMLIELIDAKISEYKASDSSDGGLIESILVSKIKKELDETVEDED